MGANARIYRHTFVGVEVSRYLVPLANTAGLDYAGVVGAAVFLGGGMGNAAGGRACPVIQEGKLQFEYLGGSAGQGVVGQVAYCVTDQTVTVDWALNAQAYAVGRVAKLVSLQKVRVNITGFATTALHLYLLGVRQRVTLLPHYVTVPALGTSYRVGVREVQFSATPAVEGESGLRLEMCPATMGPQCLGLECALNRAPTEH